MTKNGLSLGTFECSTPTSAQGHGDYLRGTVAPRKTDGQRDLCVLALWMMGAGDVTVSEEKRGQNRHLPF